MHIERNLTDRILKWIDRPEVIAIKGPRQAGKTTILHILKNRLLDRGNVTEDQVQIVNFERRRLLEQFESNPIQFVEGFLPEETKKRCFLFLDEFQYVQEGGQKLKLIYDEFHPNVKLVVTGSSSLELTTSVADFMVGRMLSAYLFPLTFDEVLREQSTRLYRIWKQTSDGIRSFLFDEAEPEEIMPEPDPYLEELNTIWTDHITYGGYPAVVSEQDDELKKVLLENLVDTYIDRDIVGLLQEERIREFRQMVRILASQSGQLLNYQQISNDTGLTYRKVKHFLSVLEETYIAGLIHPLHGNLTTELKKNPCSYILDQGLRNSLIQSFAPVETRPDKGQLVEGSVYSNIYTDIHHNGEILFWRTTGGAEVDFVIRQGQSIYPVEVKYQSRTSTTLNRGIFSFIDSYQPEQFLMLTRDFWGQRTVNSTEVLFCPACYCPTVNGSD